MQKSEIQHRPQNPLQHPQKLIVEIHQCWTVNHVFWMLSLYGLLRLWNFYT